MKLHDLIAIKFDWIKNFVKLVSNNLLTHLCFILVEQNFIVSKNKLSYRACINIKFLITIRI